jgi:hypothetical protein
MRDPRQLQEAVSALERRRAAAEHAAASLTPG